MKLTVRKRFDRSYVTSSNVLGNVVSDWEVKGSGVYSIVLESKYFRQQAKYIKKHHCAKEFNEFIKTLQAESSYQKLHSKYQWHQLTDKTHIYNGIELKAIDCHPIEHYDNDAVALLCYDHDSSTIILYDLGPHSRIFGSEQLDDLIYV